MPASTIRLINTTPHIIGITLTGGWVQNVPSRDEAPNGIELAMDESARARFDRAIQTTAVQQWIAEGRLLVVVVPA